MNEGEGENGGGVVGPRHSSGWKGSSYLFHNVDSKPCQAWTLLFQHRALNYSKAF